MSDKEPQRDPETISYPGETGEMQDQPHDEMRDYRGSDLLIGRRALITGGDSGIGRAVAVAFAKEGADVAFAYLEESDDARHTAKLVEQCGRKCAVIEADLSKAENCRRAVETTVSELGGLDLLVNNVAYQEPQDSLDEISDEQWDRTFATNIGSYFWTTKAALAHIPEHGSIVNTASVNGLRGNKTLIDYSATKGAVLAFTYALAQTLLERKIRVNAVAPGPVWTPLIPATMPPEKVESFGSQAPMKRAAQPDEIAPSYVFFAADKLSSYYSGEVLAPVGGETMPG